MEEIDILIIDDVVSASRQLEKICLTRTPRIKVCNNPKEGFDFITNHQPKIVFIDYYMPEINGDDLIIKISENKLFRRSSFVLVSSAEFTEQQKIGLRTLGFEKIFKKPVAEQELAQFLTQNLI